MKKYETVVIFQPRLTDAEAKDEIKRLETWLTAQSVSELRVDYTGRRELAFAINKDRSGHYVNFYFTSDSSDLIDKLNASLRITENVIKFQTHRLSDRVRKFKGRRSQSSGDDDTALDLGGY